MIPIIDYHMHTPLCGHAVGEPKEYAGQAVKAGLQEIGFSDHAPLVSHRDPTITMDFGELPLYYKMIEDVQRQFKGKLHVKMALEADFIPGFEAKTKKILDDYPYDYVIGSVHFMVRRAPPKVGLAHHKSTSNHPEQVSPKGERVEGLPPIWGFDNPDERGQWNEQDVNQVYHDYFDLLRQSAQTRLFNIMGHVDLVKKFGNRPTEDMTKEVEKTAEVFKKCSVAVEINTSGLRKPVKEMYPSLAYLKIYCQAGVPLTFGSDAHDPKDVGKDFDKAVVLAKEAGYREYVVFSKRKIDQTIKL